MSARCHALLDLVQLTQVTRERDAAHAETDAAKRSAELEARRLREATQAREAALVSKHAVEMSHAVGRQRDELRLDLSLSRRASC